MVRHEAADRSVFWEAEPYCRDGTEMVRTLVGETTRVFEVGGPLGHDLLKRSKMIVHADSGDVEICPTEICCVSGQVRTNARCECVGRH